MFVDDGGYSEKTTCIAPFKGKWGWRYWELVLGLVK
jgi:hypothetical protein